MGQNTYAAVVSDHRLRINIREPHAGHLFADARLLRSARGWLDEAVDPDGDEVVAEAWGHVQDDGTFYVSQVVAHRLNRGLGRECLAALLRTARRRGIDKARCYVVHENLNSQRMLRALGFREAEQTAHGSYWTADLTRSRRRRR